MAATILDLSNELLTEVVKCLAKYRRSILALTLTCRQISHIARHALYRDIELYHWKLARHNSDSSRLLLLLRTWKANSILLTQTLSNITIHNATRSEHDLDFSSLLEILADAKALRTLTIYRFGTNHIRDLVSAFQNPARNPFPALERFDIWIDRGRYLDPSVCLSLITCLRSSLREIQTDSALEVHRPYIRVPVPPVISKKSAMRSLMMRGPMMSSSALKLILSSTPNLEILETRIPDNHVLNYADLTRRIAESAVLKPRELGRDLLLVRQTLRRLKITSPQPIVLEYDHSQIDLAAFTCLEDLQISSVLLLGNVSCMSKTPNINVSSLLPPSLTKLFICFDTLQGIFHCNADLRATMHDPLVPINREWSDLWCGGPGNPFIVRESFSWLHGLSDRCKKLEQVILEETHSKKLLVRKKRGRVYTRTPDSFLSIDVVPYHATFFAGFPFECKVIIYVDSEWWKFVRRCPCWSLVADSRTMLPWIKFDDV